LGRELNAQSKSRVDRAQDVRRIGGRLHPLSDFYHTLMRASWPTTFGVILAALVVVNVLYASVYVLLGDGIEGVRAGNFEDCFFFSVQTLATIGYGKMVPVTRAAHVIVTLEAFTGVLVTAVTTGILFAKFSRPTARVLFSRVCVIAPFEGKRTLMFRIANERANRIVQASVKLTALRFVTTEEGHVLRRLLDLKLHRSDSAMFAITWSVFHTIDESSPLFGLDAEALAKERFALVVTLVGLDETLAQTVHARHSWEHDEIVFDRRFVDVLAENEDGSRTMDLTKFHDTLPIN
jgi:inward rectifier potassium channel